MSLFVGLTLNTAKGTEGIITIQKGSKAPYTGNLMPVSTFSQIYADAEIKTELEKQLNMCNQDKASCITAQDSDATKWFGAGAALGIIGVLIVQSVGK